MRRPANAPHLLNGLSLIQSAMNDFSSLSCSRNLLIEVTALITR